MKKYELLRCNSNIIRVLEINADAVLVVDCISREGLKAYQRDHRPLLGDGVQEFAHSVGIYEQ